MIVKGIIQKSTRTNIILKNKENKIMAFERREPLRIEGARIIFKNFRGEPSQFNKTGKKQFSVVIPDEVLALKLKEDGWNIKTLAPKHEDQELTYCLPAEARYDNIPPKIMLVTRRNPRGILLDEESVSCLDYADITNIDLALSPSFWEIKDPTGIKSGIKAYVKEMWVTVVEDEFASKYEG